MDSMPGSYIRLVFTFPPKDSTLQYKKAYTSEITFLALVPWALDIMHWDLDNYESYSSNFYILKSHNKFDTLKCQNALAFGFTSQTH